MWQKIVLIFYPIMNSILKTLMNKKINNRLTTNYRRQVFYSGEKNFFKTANEAF